MSSTGKTGGILTGLINPVAKKPAGAPIVVSPEAEKAFGLEERLPPPQPAPVAPARKEETRPYRHAAGAPEPERSKTFFLPMNVCERLEMQKLSERREMKHIVRQALEEYFERNPLREAVRGLLEA